MLLFIDQPIGVGLSNVNPNIMVNNTVTAGEHILNFFDNFFSKYDNLL